jgi:environmental stress-induced protein Ves
MEFPFILKSNSQDIKKWSGGTTTQLCIYPFDSLYEDRTFIFRVSTATIEVESSAFTSLPSYHRSLMILEGVLEIKHTGHYTRTLKQFEIDEFEGGWETYGCGIVTDFNVMTSEKAQHTLNYIQMKANELQTLEIDDRTFHYVGYYILSKQLNFHLDNKLYQLEHRDFILVDSNQTRKIEFQSNDEIEMIQVTFTIR